MHAQDSCPHVAVSSHSRVEVPKYEDFVFGFDLPEEVAQVTVESLLHFSVGQKGWSVDADDGSKPVVLYREAERHESIRMSDRQTL